MDIRSVDVSTFGCLAALTSLFGCVDSGYVVLVR